MRINGRTLRPSTLAERRIMFSLGIPSIRVPRGTNPFVVVSHDPLSTFAADVDTASYQIFKRDVLNDMRPRPESVRLEEYVNYFDYGYAPPQATSPHPFAISLEAAA